MPSIDAHQVLMTGENSFIRLSHDGGKTMSDRTSHWRVLWCPAGSGHALFMQGELTDGEVHIYLLLVPTTQPNRIAASLMRSLPPAVAGLSGAHRSFYEYRRSSEMSHRRSLTGSRSQTTVGRPSSR